MKLSIVIPTYNEAAVIGRLVRYLRRYSPPKEVEVLVVDGNSTDATLDQAKRAGARVFPAPRKERAAQMNYGASQARGEILYFVHADVIPPSSFYEDIVYYSHRWPAGRYAMWFKSKRPALMINELFSHLNFLWCSGGDQTLFIRRPEWDILGGYDEGFVIMEEYDFLARLKQHFAFKVIHKHVRTTDRKYQGTGFLKVNWANFQAFRMWRKGIDPQEIKRFYREALQNSRY